MHYANASRTGPENRCGAAKVAALAPHPLHDGGFQSIGCAPCAQRGSGRDGRWAGGAKTERGPHV